MVETALTKPRAVDRNELESLDPGLYLFDEPGKARIEHQRSLIHDAPDHAYVENSSTDVRYTGRILARVREGTAIPSGVMDGWIRFSDGRAVFLFEETVLP